MPAAKVNHTIEQGADWMRMLRFLDTNRVAIDLTGDTFRGEIKTAYGTPDLAVGTIAFDLSNLALGEVVYYLTDVQTAGLPDTTNTDPLVYDIFRTRASDGFVSRVIYGTIKVKPRATT